MRNFFLILISTVITLFVFSFFSFGFNPFKSLIRQGEMIFGKVARSDIENAKRYLARADAYAKEAQSLKADKDRAIFIDKVEKFKYNFELAMQHTGAVKEGKSDILAFVIQAAARDLFLWSPLYYDVHTDAKKALRPVIQMVEERHNDLLTELAGIDGEEAGRIAVQDFQAHIRDVTHSAQRRNSDFIRFSYEDYARYREFFDKLRIAYPRMLLGFAEQGYSLFWDFYLMHQEVDREYSEKTRSYINNFRLNIRDLHREAILELKKADESRAREALQDTIAAIDASLRNNENIRAEVKDLMNDDYAFYKIIQNEWNT